MKCIVGLGNIGITYQHTYHNVGFDCLDHWMGEQSFREESRFHSLISEQQGILYQKPTTLMNRSGEAVSKLLRYYKIPPLDLIVIHDDSDITLGQYKIQTNRGSGGHHGIDSIIQYLGTKDFTRIRIGIRSERFEGWKADRFVLRPISSEDQRILTPLYDQVKSELQFSD